MKGESLYTVFSKALSSEEKAISYFEKMRWDGNVISPFDPTSKVYKCGNGNTSVRVLDAISMLKQVLRLQTPNCQ